MALKFYPGQGDYLAQLNNVADITNVYLLGAKAANPTTDNNGNPLVISAVYWNTVAPELRMWTGAVWTAIPTGSYSLAADKDASGGYAGLTGFAINLWNAAKTFKSSLTFSGAANRVHTFQDRDGTLADDTDLALKVALTTNLVASTDLNTIVTSGLYRIQDTPVNGPTAISANYSQMLVSRGSTTLAQVIWEYSTGRTFSRVAIFGSAWTWTPWRENYHQSSILGTVSQASGVPTGALIERGNNANGEYVRYADGMQVCTASFANGSCTTAEGSLFISAEYPWTFPAAFIAAPSYSATAGNLGFVMGFVGVSPTSVSFKAARGTSGTASTPTVIAVGRWF